MTTPSGMSMGASGHRTGCSERNQKGDSKSSYILIHVLFPFLKAPTTWHIYPITLMWTRIAIAY